MDTQQVHSSCILQTMLTVMTKSLLFFMIAVCMLKPSIFSEASEIIPSAFAPQRGDNCGKGQYTVVDDYTGVSCLPCPTGRYMDEEHHRHTECKVCTSLETHLHYKVLKQNCTPTTDTVFGCAEHYFMGLNSECRICTQCQHESFRHYEASPCTQDSDRRCCERPGMRIEWKKGGYNCVSDVTPKVPLPISANCANSSLRTSGCLAGEYLVAECQINESLFICKPCVRGTYLNVSHHNRTTCKPCSLPTENYNQILFICNGTHDNIYKKASVSPSNKTLLMILIAVVSLLVVFVLAVVCMLWKYPDKRRGLKESCKRLLSRKRNSNNTYNRGSNYHDSKYYSSTDTDDS